MLKPLVKKKLTMLASQWLKCCVSILPKTISDCFKSVFLLAISYFITFNILGTVQANDKVSSGLIDLTSLTIFTIAYLVIHMFIISPILAYKKYRKMGFWDGATFHYHTEVLVYTGVIHPSGQTVAEVEFPRECKNMFVSTHTTISGAFQRVKAGFACMKNADGKWHISMSNGSSRSSIRLYECKQGLVRESLPGTVPTRVKVYLESWTL